MRLIPMLLAICVFATPASADSHQPVDNLVSLSVAASEDVDNDLLVVRMYVEHEAKKQSDASERVNEDMAWALGSARQQAGVRVQTLGYRTNPVYDERRVRAWRTRQSLRLESTDKDGLTTLMGVLQERLAIESVSYEVSDGVREAAEDRLIAAAVERFSARSQRIAAAFGRDTYALVNVNIHTEGHAPPPVAYAGRALAMRAEGASPAIESGVQSITVTASGTIEIAP